MTGGLGDRGPLRVGPGVVLTSDDDWRWKLPFVAAGSPYLLEGWSSPGELRLALHRGLEETAKVLAVGSVDLEVSS